MTTDPTNELLYPYITGTGASAMGNYQAALMWECEADRLARKLLFDHLTPEQRRDYAASNRFISVGNYTRMIYRLSIGDTYRMTDGHTFCLVVVDAVPPEDALLARKILIECNERLFLEVANDLTEQRNRFNIILEGQRRTLPRQRVATPPSRMGRRGRALYNRLRQW